MPISQKSKLLELMIRPWTFPSVRKRWKSRYIFDCFAMTTWPYDVIFHVWNSLANIHFVGKFESSSVKTEKVINVCSILAISIIKVEFPKLEKVVLHIDFYGIFLTAWKAIFQISGDCRDYEGIMGDCFKSHFCKKSRRNDIFYLYSTSKYTLPS